MRVLLIEDSPTQAQMVQQALGDIKESTVEVKWAHTLEIGLEKLKVEKLDVVLLDLFLPDSQGMDTVTRVRAQAPKAPIVVLTAAEDQELATKGIQAGAQDYLVKGEMDGDLLARAMRYAIERQQLLANLQDTQAQLIQAEKLQSIGRLAAGVAHEVKNPLAIIRMGVDFLLTRIKTDEEDIKQCLHDVEHAVGRADSVIRGVLDFSSLRQINMELVDLHDMLNETLLLLKHDFDKCHTKVTRDFSKDVSEVRLDKNRMQQVFINLMTNAVHAMPDQGEITIKTYLKKLGQGADKTGRRKNDVFSVGESVVVVEILDTGTGIPDEILRRIYDPFFTTKKTGKGTGLGLSITKSIVDMHRGDLSIRNREEGGVQTTIMLKLK